MKVGYLVTMDVDPMQVLDMGMDAQTIKSALWDALAHLPKDAIEVAAPADIWRFITDGDKGELVKLVTKAIRHGFGDHPEKMTDMNALTASIAKRLAGELWARRNIGRPKVSE